MSDSESENVDQIKEWKKQRGIYKGKLTLYIKFLNSLNSDLTKITADQAIDLELRTNKIQSALDGFDKYQTLLELASSDSEELSAERQNFEDSFYKNVAKANLIIVSKKRPEIPHERKHEHSHDCSDSIKFPEITLPTFSGSYKQWLEFRETFEALVHSSSLKPIQKFKYLRSCLQDSALEVVSSLEYTADNYYMAWKLLCERYNNPRLLVFTHLKSLFDIDQIQETSQALRSTIDNISKHLRSLRTLSIAVDEWDLIIIYFIVAKLPISMQKKWEEHINSKDLPSLQDFKSFLRKRADLLETMTFRVDTEKPPKKSLLTTSHPESGQRGQSSTTGNHGNCPNCKAKHFITQLRSNVVRKLHLCFNCLRPGHALPSCRSSLCRLCNGKHHSLLHIDRTQTSYHNNNHTFQNTQPTTMLNSQTNGTQNTNPLHNNTPTNNAIPNPSSHQNQVSNNNTQLHSDSTHTNAVSSNQLRDKTVILTTALVYVSDHLNRRHTLRALLDSGSQSNFISEKAFSLLNLPMHSTNMQVIGFNNNSSTIDNYCNLQIESRTRPYKRQLTCLIVPTICNLSRISVNKNLLRIPQFCEHDLADENYCDPGEIDILLGVELFYEILCEGQHKLGEGLPILQNTNLGWVISGAIPITPPGKRQVRCNLNINSEMQRLWELPECYNDTTSKESILQLSDDEKICEDIFMTHTRSSDGNFVVNLPFKTPISALGQSKATALSRFYSIEKRFERDPLYKDMYVNFMSEFERSGRMVKSFPDQSYNYLPHHAVINLNKVSTPLRVVFNASSPTSTGISLNDLQYKGTIKQDPLIDILLRFRLHKYVVTADIEKMFCNILVSPEQRHLQSIFWRTHINNPIETYTLNTLSFGLKSAPHIATRCLLQLSHEITQAKHLHSSGMKSSSSAVATRAAEAIASSFYLDDLLYGGDDKQQVTDTILEVQRVLKSAQFHLRKWKSNSKEIEGIVSHITNAPTHTPTHLTNTRFREDDTCKVLGLEWSSTADVLLYCTKLQLIPSLITKRAILSRLSSIFDPLGLIGPIIVVGKCLIQKLWRDKTGWDEPIPNHLLDLWNSFYSKLHCLTQLKLPRQVVIEYSQSFQLHGFSDASNVAYGAAIYTRTVDQAGECIVHLLYSCSRVAPIKPQTIPRLELCAALLLARIMNKVKVALKRHIDDIKYWSDSNITLAWIRTEPQKLNTFVRNRVSEIQSLTATKDWHWVQSAENPADVLSRGVSADKLVNHDLWWHGPLWLRKALLAKPQPLQEINPLPESKQSDTHCNTTRQSPSNSDHSIIQKLVSKYSSDLKLFRVFAYVQRFIHNCQQRTSGARQDGPLTISEIECATLTLTKNAQVESFPVEYNLLKNNQPLNKNSKLRDLKPFYDKGVLRVGGRLALSQYSYNKKHPIILDGKHILTKLIMSNEHKRLLHAGPSLLLAATRERFWPIKGKYLANKILHECVACFRAKPTSTEPTMGNLPGSRVTPSPPFHTAGLDYAGHFTLRDRRGRGYKTYKCYVGIFVCFVTKAVHFELISGLHTEAFLAAFRRFISRRGMPKQLVSDNGTTFKGASNDLKQLYDFINISSPDLTTSCANIGFEWKFLPVYTPHMAGLAESAVKSCKYHLKRVIGQGLLTYEEFSTVLIQIEGILNSRPLCPIPTSDKEDIQILTPAHFLIGRTPVALPDYDYVEVPSSRLNHFQLLQQMQQNFWQSWSRDYLGVLQQRTKWRCAKGPALAIGTVVIIKDVRLPTCQWALGRISEVHPGADGEVRVATIKTSKGIVKRAFNNLCPLPISLEYSD
ncbi:hypothetical protein ABMA27_005221 [Loxostege sticticalis]|uniref:Integrase catalytic domain-containing protein n=1 Tax=Loxostege sticticalis TaxID=481309 RepID=A0ABR3HM81_LOXSC